VVRILINFDAMKYYHTRLTAALALSLLLTTIFAQEQYTPYDDLPGMIKSYKPSYNTEFPVWAKMLYEYPVNYNEVVETFNNFSDEDRGELGAITRYYKIWHRHLEPWVMLDGSIYLPDLDDYYRRARAAQLAAGKKGPIHSISISDWYFLGPKETFWLNESGVPLPPKSCPWQVNVYSFDVSSSDNNVLFCGTETGFVNRSGDKGQSWQLLGQDYSFGGGVTATVIHPLDNETVYVAAGNQVHKTTDGGITWFPLLDVNNLFAADRLKIDPTNPEKVLAAANSGVYVSTDGGQSWDRTWTSRAYDVDIKANDPDMVYALTKSGNNFSIIRSTDGGFLFETDTGFPADISDVSGGLLSVTPANPNILLAVMLSSNNTPYLYKGLLDSGEWSLLATGQTTDFPMNNGQGYFDLILEISPVDEEIIFAGTTSLFKSSNGGQSFIAIGGYTGAFAIHPDIQDMKLLPNGET